MDHRAQRLGESVHGIWREWNVDVGGHKLPDGFQTGRELEDQRIGVNLLRELRDLIEEVADDGGLADELRELRRVVSRNEHGRDIGAANPCAERNENDEVLVFLLGHGEFDLVLGGFEFLAEGAPVVVGGEVIDAVPATEDALADIEFLGEIDDILAGVFYALSILSLHRNVAVCDEDAKHQRHLLPAGGGRGSLWLE